jgi:hypothetical protein
MVKRVVTAAVIALVLAAAPAGAQQYPPAENSLIISDTTPTPGQTISIEAKTFTAGTEVTITLNSDPVVLGAPTANEGGVAGLSATIPSTVPLGSHTIVATGTGADGAPLTLTASITVVADGAGSGSGGGSGSGSLPRTGDDSSLPLARIGLALAAAGGVITAVAAKRRKAAAAA